jgi:hypothetical protein
MPAELEHRRQPRPRNERLSAVTIKDPELVIRTCPAKSSVRTSARKLTITSLKPVSSS